MCVVVVVMVVVCGGVCVCAHVCQCEWCVCYALEVTCLCVCT